MGDMMAAQQPDRTHDNPPATPRDSPAHSFDDLCCRLSRQLDISSERCVPYRAFFEQHLMVSPVSLAQRWIQLLARRATPVDHMTVRMKSSLETAVRFEHGQPRGFSLVAVPLPMQCFSDSLHHNRRLLDELLGLAGCDDSARERQSAIFSSIYPQPDQLEWLAAVARNLFFGVTFTAASEPAIKLYYTSNLAHRSHRDIICDVLQQLGLQEHQELALDWEASCNALSLHRGIGIDISPAQSLRCKLYHLIPWKWEEELLKFAARHQLPFAQASWRSLTEKFAATCAPQFEVALDLGGMGKRDLKINLMFEELESAELLVDLFCERSWQTTRLEQLLALHGIQPFAGGSVHALSLSAATGLDGPINVYFMPTLQSASLAGNAPATDWSAPTRLHEK